MFPSISLSSDIVVVASSVFYYKISFVVRGGFDILVYRCDVTFFLWFVRSKTNIANTLLHLIHSFILTQKSMYTGFPQPDRKPKYIVI